MCITLSMTCNINLIQIIKWNYFIKLLLLCKHVNPWLSQRHLKDKRFKQYNNEFTSKKFKLIKGYKLVCGMREVRLLPINKILSFFIHLLLSFTLHKREEERTKKIGFSNSVFKLYPHKMKKLIS